MIALTLTAPLAYEANPGIVQGVAPPGTTRLRVLADGHSVRVLRLTSGKRAFLIGPIGLPPRDLTLKVEALAGSRVLASAEVEHVFGLPAAAAAVAPPRSIDGAVQHTVASLPARTGVTSAAWIRDLGSGRTAAYNAGAHFPAASTVKLGILLGVLARDDADPLRSSAWSLERSLVLNSSNLAANELLPRAGGAAVVDTLRQRSARPARSRAAATCSSQARARARPSADAVSRCRRRPIVDQPTFPCCKYTTAHDLGTLLVSLMLASTGHGPALRLGITRARGARRAVAAHARGLSGARAALLPVPGRTQGRLAARHAARRRARVHAPRHARRRVHELRARRRQLRARARDAAGDVVRLALRRRG